MHNTTNYKPVIRKPTGSLRITKKSSRPKLSPRDKGEPTYPIGHHETAKTLRIRMVVNTGGGFFSNQWVGVEVVISTVDTLQSNDAFQVVIFIQFYQSSRSNIMVFLRRPYGLKEFMAAMAKLAKTKTKMESDEANLKVLLCFFEGLHHTNYPFSEMQYFAGL